MKAEMGPESETGAAFPSDSYPGMGRCVLSCVIHRGPLNAPCVAADTCAVDEHTKLTLAELRNGISDTKSAIHDATGQQSVTQSEDWYKRVAKANN